MAERPLEGAWGLILGASSGFGAATAIEVGRRGMHVVGVHLDRKATLHNVARIEQDLTGFGVKARFFNVNAADAVRRAEVVKALSALLAADRGQPLRLVMHSLAFGTLRPLVAGGGGGDAGEPVTQAQLEMTLDVMANSLVYWVQDLLASKLIGSGTRVIAMTSAGGRRVIPSYGPVSAAKAALESHVRQLAVELAPYGVSVSCLRAGVADTPALQRIPGHERIAEEARRRNPASRLTVPEDVAGVVALLCGPEARWISGDVVGVDGGEDVVA